jgi:DNA-binding IclR family transcriptional regulator
MGDHRQTGVGVLDKVMAVLAAFEADKALQTPKDIAEALDLPVPTAYRLMQAMAHHKLLEPEGRAFRLGVRLATLGLRATRELDIVKLALPHLRELADQTGENSHLNVRRDIVRVVVAFVAGSRNVRPFSAVGEVLPLGIGASGQVLLAWLDPAEAARIAAESLARFHIERSIDDLADRLRLVREVGVAISRGDRHPDVAAIAAPVRNADGEVIGSLSSVAPRSRYGQSQIRDATSLVLEAAAKVSTKLGFTARSEHRALLKGHVR